jgi:hypothetical protein
MNQVDKRAALKIIKEEVDYWQQNALSASELLVNAYDLDDKDGFKVAKQALNEALAAQKKGYR